MRECYLLFLLSLSLLFNTIQYSQFYAHLHKFICFVCQARTQQIWFVEKRLKWIHWCCLCFTTLYLQQNNTMKKDFEWVDMVTIFGLVLHHRIHNMLFNVRVLPKWIREWERKKVRVPIQSYISWAESLLHSSLVVWPAPCYTQYYILSLSEFFPFYIIMRITQYIRFYRMRKMWISWTLLLPPLSLRLLLLYFYCSLHNTLLWMWCVCICYVCVSVIPL